MAHPLTWRALALMMISLILVGATAIAVATRIGPSSSPTELAQPPSWVAFKARVAVFKPGRPRAVGRFYRNSDGSTRLETGPEDGSVVIISIRNVPSSTYYVRGLKNEWTARPMILPADGYKPVRIRSTTAGLRGYPYKLALRPGDDGSLQAASGLSAFHYINPSGDSELLAPELNFFVVLRQNLTSGRRELYSDIEIGAQPEELFAPPVGAAVQFLNVPGGIVTETPSAPLHGSSSHKVNPSVAANH